MVAFVVAIVVSYAWMGLEASRAARTAVGLQLERTARLIEGTLAEREYDDRLADSLGEAAGFRVTLIDGDGRVLGDSDVPTRRLPDVENHADRDEVRAALAGRTGISVRASETVSRSLLYVAIPARGGVLRLAVPAEDVLAPVAAGRRISLFVMLALLALTFLLGRLAVRDVRGELETVRNLLIDIGADDLPRADDAREVGFLGDAIAQMVDRLRERIAASRREAGDLRALFDGLDDGLALIERDGSVSLSNPAFERWVGRAIPPGTRFGTLFRTPRLVEAVDRAQSGEHVIEELEVGERTVLMSARPHRDGALLVLRDLTALRRLEGVRRDFVANVSHELKTPLTSVVGFAEAIAEGELPQERARDFGDRILANATRMRLLVDDLLDLARVESGAWVPDPEVVVIGEVAREAWSTRSPSAPGRHPVLEVDDAGVPAFADRDAVRQILRNLLDNAARHSEASGTILVRVRPDGLLVRCEVIDEGRGIPSKHLDRVFERFYRVDPARSREQGGTGLGLAIVKHLVEGHGGDVGIHSAVGRGTTVHFTLPVAGESVADG
ncbi:MAG: ATP-binding protein, partial [Gemmatimonadota bacterium]|nr:ATP-binding protein [Gemmatimonadota bacterium]